MDASMVSSLSNHQNMFHHSNNAIDNNLYTNPIDSTNVNYKPLYLSSVAEVDETRVLPNQTLPLYAPLPAYNEFKTKTVNVPEMCNQSIVYSVENKYDESHFKEKEGNNQQHQQQQQKQQIQPTQNMPSVYESSYICSGNQLYKQPVRAAPTIATHLASNESETLIAENIHSKSVQQQAYENSSYANTMNLSSHHNTNSNLEHSRLRERDTHTLQTQPYATVLPTSPYTNQFYNAPKRNYNNSNGESCSYNIQTNLHNAAPAITYSNHNAYFNYPSNATYEYATQKFYPLGNTQPFASSRNIPIPNTYYTGSTLVERAYDYNEKVADNPVLPKNPTKPMKTVSNCYSPSEKAEEPCCKNKIWNWNPNYSTAASIVAKKPTHAIKYAPAAVNSSCFQESATASYNNYCQEKKDKYEKLNAIFHQQTSRPQALPPPQSYIWPSNSQERLSNDLYRNFQPTALRSKANAHYFAAESATILNPQQDCCKNVLQQQNLYHPYSLPFHYSNIYSKTSNAQTQHAYTGGYADMLASTKKKSSKGNYKITSAYNSTPTYGFAGNQACYLTASSGISAVQPRKSLNYAQPGERASAASSYYANADLHTVYNAPYGMENLQKMQRQPYVQSANTVMHNNPTALANYVNGTYYSPWLEYHKRTETNDATKPRQQFYSLPTEGNNESYTFNMSNNYWYHNPAHAAYGLDLAEKTSVVSGADVSSKVTSIRDFLTTWNDDEEVFDSSESNSYELETDMSITPQSMQNRTAKEAIVPNLANAVTTQATGLLVNNVSSVNLPDIVIDIEKPKETIASLSASHTSTTVEYFDVEKELDNLQNKGEPSTVDVDSSALCQEPLAEISLLEKHVIYDEIVNLCKEDEKANYIKEFLEKPAAELEHSCCDRDKGLNHKNMENDNESSFEKAYESFINNFGNSLTLKNEELKKKSSIEEYAFEHQTLPKQELQLYKNACKFSKFHKKQRQMSNSVKKLITQKIGKNSRRKSVLNKNSHLKKILFKLKQQKLLKQHTTTATAKFTIKMHENFVKYSKKLLQLKQHRSKKIKQNDTCLTKHCTTIMTEQHLPLIKRQSLKSCNFNITDTSPIPPTKVANLPSASIYMPKSLQTLCLCAVNTPKFHEMILKDRKITQNFITNIDENMQIDQECFKNKENNKCNILEEKISMQTLGEDLQNKNNFIDHLTLNEQSDETTAIQSTTSNQIVKYECKTTNRAVNINDVMQLKKILDADFDNYCTNDESFLENNTEVAIGKPEVTAIPSKLSDLCRAVQIKMLSYECTANEEKKNECELSVEDALAEMYAQVGVSSDTANMECCSDEAQHNVLLIAVEDILQCDNDLFVVQCDMNENILSVLGAHSDPNEENKLNLSSECLTTNGCTKIEDHDRIKQTTSKTAYEQIDDACSNVTFYHEFFDNNLLRNTITSETTGSQELFSSAMTNSGNNSLLDNQTYDGNESLLLGSEFDLPVIHHEEVVAANNFTELRKDKFLKYMYKKYVQNSLSKFHYSNRILKKYRRKLN